mgnify:CR=1
MTYGLAGTTLLVDIGITVELDEEEQVGPNDEQTHPVTITLEASARAIGEVKLVGNDTVLHDEDDHELDDLD